MMIEHDTFESGEIAGKDKFVVDKDRLAKWKNEPVIEGQAVLGGSSS